MIRGKAYAVYLAEETLRQLDLWDTPMFFVRETGLDLDFVALATQLEIDINLALAKHPTFHNHFRVVADVFWSGVHGGTSISVVPDDEIGHYLMRGRDEINMTDHPMTFLLQDIGAQDHEFAPGDRFWNLQNKRHVEDIGFISTYHTEAVPSRMPELSAFVYAIIAERAFRVLEARMIIYDINDYVEADATILSIADRPVGESFIIRPMIGYENDSVPIVTYLWRPGISSPESPFIKEDSIVYRILDTDIDRAFRLRGRMFDILSTESKAQFYIPSTDHIVKSIYLIRSSDIPPTEHEGFYSLISEFRLVYVSY